MKSKSCRAKNIEKKVDAVFRQRESQYKSYGYSRRVPKQDHYAASIQKKSRYK